MINDHRNENETKKRERKENSERENKESEKRICSFAFESNIWSTDQIETK